jgi:hypothetical protein
VVDADRELAQQRKRTEDADLAFARAAVEAAAAFAASPVGQARAAFRRGDAFFEVAIEVNRPTGASAARGSSSRSGQRRGRPDVLGQIEEEGFRLEHVGYVFIQTDAAPPDRVPNAGQGTVPRGFVQGVYLFRRAEEIET